MRALVVAGAMSAVCLGIGLWEIVSPPAPDTPWFVRPGPAGLVAGIIFGGFVLVELVHRLRHGPRAPGRHMRDSDEDRGP